MSDITVMLSLLPLRKRQSRLPAPSTLGSSRIEVCPPSLRQAPESLGERIVFWLTAPSPLEAAPPPSRMPAVREDFSACVLDLHGAEAGDVLARIARAHTLRELWHLRTEVHRVVALERGERVAGERIAQLNRHFPTRAARASALASL